MDVFRLVKYQPASFSFSSEPMPDIGVCERGEANQRPLAILDIVSGGSGACRDANGAEIRRTQSLAGSGVKQTQEERQEKNMGNKSLPAKPESVLRRITAKTWSTKFLLYPPPIDRVYKSLHGSLAADLTMLNKFLLGKLGTCTLARRALTEE